MTRIDLPLLRTSERTTYKRCPWKWLQSSVRGLEPINQRIDARWFGTGIHLCKAEWYIPGIKRGRNMHDTWDEYAEGHYATVRAQELNNDEFEAKYVDANQLAHDMIDAHMELYGNDDNWEVIAAEQRFNVLIPHPLIKDEPVARYVGTIDLIIRELDSREIWLDDTKTAARIYTHHLPLLEQPTSYVAVGTHTLREQGLIGPKERVRGIIFDFMRKALKDDRPRNPATGLICNKPLKKHYIEALVGHFGREYVQTETSNKHFSKMKLDELAEVAESQSLEVYGDPSKDQGAQNFLREYITKSPKECKRQIQRIGEEVLHMEAVRNGTLPVLKTPQDDCSFCDYFDLCELDEAGGDTEYFEQGAFRVRDLYADHRENAENSKTSVQNKITTGVS